MEKQVWPGSISGMAEVVRGVKSDWDWGSGGLRGLVVRLWDLEGWFGGGWKLTVVEGDAQLGVVGVILGCEGKPSTRWALASALV
jgi:hypothetical protein